MHRQLFLFATQIQIEICRSFVNIEVWPIVRLGLTWQHVTISSVVTILLF